MGDDQIVDAGTVSPESGTVSPEAGTSLEGEPQPQPQPLTREDVARMIAEQTEVAKREIQSAKDKARAEIVEAQRRAGFAESSLARVRGKFEELDPEARQVLENEDLRARVQFFEQRQQQEAIERQRAEYTQSLNQALLGHLSDLGIDPKDERIDWAHDATNLPDGLKRFNKSLAKIAKEGVQATEQKTKQDATDKLAHERKEAGLDSTDTGVPVGVSKGIPTHMDAFRKWVKGLSTEEYAAKQKDIEEMLEKKQIR